METAIGPSIYRYREPERSKSFVCNSCEIVHGCCENVLANRQVSFPPQSRLIPQNPAVLGVFRTMQNQLGMD